jgi:hypothetical protein
VIRADAPGQSCRPLEFLDALGTCFARAAATHGTEHRRIVLGDREIGLDFAGAGLADALTMALASVDDRPVRTTLHRIACWDTEATLVGVPPPPSNPFARQGLLLSAREGLRLLFSAASGTLHASPVSGAASFTWVRARRALPGWELAAPLRPLFAWLVEDCGSAFVHAAVVGHEAGGLLLAGPSGSGKSTAALACVCAGARFLADDCAILSLGPELRARSVYRTAKVGRARLADDFTELRSLETELEHDRGKAILAFPREGQMLLSRCPIAAIVVPSVVDHSSSRLERISPAAALTALAPSTLLQVPGTTAKTLDILAAAVGSVPCYRLAAGDRLPAMASTLLSLL